MCFETPVCLLCYYQLSFFFSLSLSLIAQLDATLFKGQRLLLTEILWMKFKTDHMLYNKQQSSCVCVLARIKVQNSCQLLRLCDAYFRCMVSVSRQISPHQQAN